MKLDTQKRLAADILKCSEKRVQFDTEQLESIGESITKEDIRRLIAEGAITRKPVAGVSRARARKRLVQRRKGRQRGHGTRKGTANARSSFKRMWIDRIRAQKKTPHGAQRYESNRSENIPIVVWTCKGRLLPFTPSHQHVHR